MASINRVILIGNLGRAPEYRVDTDGTPVATFNLATNRKYQGTTYTEWHRVHLSGPQAEHAHATFQKGQSIYVEGSLRTMTWETKRTKERRQATYIRADIAYPVVDSQPTQH